jgi:hypothetical protein
MNRPVLLQYVFVADLDLSCTEDPQCDGVANTCPDMRPTPPRTDTPAASVLSPLAAAQYKPISRQQSLIQLLQYNNNPIVPQRKHPPTRPLHSSLKSNHHTTILPPSCTPIFKQIALWGWKFCRGGGDTSTEHSNMIYTLQDVSTITYSGRKITASFTDRYKYARGRKGKTARR